MSHSFWHIRKCSLFSRLDEVHLQKLEFAARSKKFPKGSSVYLPTDEADSACLLAEGRVRICSTTPDGKQSILGFVEPGELFGEMSVIDPTQREERAEAMCNSTVILLPGNAMRELMEKSPQLSLSITKLIGLRRKRIERRLKSLLYRNNRDRLSHLLTELAEQYGSPTTEGIELKIRISHQELAALIGATRETVTTLLGEMQNDGLVRIRRQRLIVRDLNRLNLELRGTAPPKKESMGAMQARDSASASNQQLSSQQPGGQHADALARLQAFGKA